ncbi:hypothetical protein LNP74_32120 [Klebsiella pneumoniae subsp. pneumoniae]|nr:hypothetical protein [Klebsiella pneumoniae subsp. pneumoniae]
MKAIADGVEVLSYYMLVSSSTHYQLLVKPRQMSKRYGLSLRQSSNDLGRGDGRRFCKKSYYWYQKLTIHHNVQITRGISMYQAALRTSRDLSDAALFIYNDYQGMQMHRR